MKKVLGIKGYTPAMLEALRQGLNTEQILKVKKGGFIALDKFLATPEGVLNCYNSPNNNTHDDRPINVIPKGEKPHSVKFRQVGEVFHNYRSLPEFTKGNIEQNRLPNIQLSLFDNNNSNPKAHDALSRIFG